MTDKRATFGHSRRNFLTAAGAGATLALAGCMGSSDDDETTITWVMNPAEEAVDIATQYRPLFNYLEAETGVTIEGQETADYAATVQALQRADENDRMFADTSPGAVAQIPDDIDVVGMRLAFGSELYYSLITTTVDSGIDSLEELEGETIATAGATSVSGTLAPMLMLSQAGLDVGGAPDGSPNDFDWRPSDHDTAREQLVQDPDIMAAGTGAFSTAPHVPQEQFDELSEDFADISAEYDGAGSRDPELKLLAVSDPIPRAPIVVNADWDEDLRYELEDLMHEAESDAFQHDPVALAEDLSMDPEILDKDEDELTEEEQEQLSTFADHELWFDGIEPADHSDYAPISDLANELGLDFEEL
ncbi:phosphate/phosphite/phosphonate ABC transporter substrate-binding protein [Natronocalculus amylovorans]|uniref:Phosphate/phosphite/phosphonate ABC transporter substrate-binding protein n=1 Tax=Natronocalculus amylovorans TaxID=2917812 RepID=A0AAE3K782_9EURY|nr:PhnD/SsuA/transferrin family substrate-binding protein [Natronocalculus amylovorans]MCL9815756.1 phosphate/phosphite/phosphonate ABC transporter substrate-binding protein [Natronocalculus amylovorans]